MATCKAYSKCKNLIFILVLLLLPIVAYAALTDQGDGTVLDDTNNLIWKTVLEGDKTWTEATSDAASAVDLGYSDWRLPTLAELQSIIDSNYQPQIDPVFLPGTHPGNWTLWSSDTIEDDDFILFDRAYVVYFGDGTSRSVPKLNRYPFRLVRDFSFPPEEVIYWDIASFDVILWETGGDSVKWQ